MSFSRPENFFRPEQNYTALRIHQGVPLLDADWAENTEILRNEIYQALSVVFSDGIQPGTSSFEILPGDPENVLRPPNNFFVRGGTALIQGRPVTLQNGFFYSDQRWIDAQVARDNGVTPIELIETPTEGERLLAYLDIWERVVTIGEFEIEDSERIILENRDIALNIVTSTRVKREIAVRVTRSEGDTSVLPEVEDGHLYMPLAVLNRRANNPAFPPEGIEDIRPMLWGTKGRRAISFSPEILPARPGEPVWTVERGTSQFGFTGRIARVFSEDDGNGFARGFLPISLPNGAQLLQLNIWGNSSGSVANTNTLTIEFYRFPNDNPQNITQPEIGESLHDLVDERFSVEPNFQLATLINSSNGRNFVNNFDFFYGIYITGVRTTPGSITVLGISISYEY